MSTPNQHTRRFVRYATEATCVLGILCISLWFLAMRTSHRCFPSGDEGSWMSVASQLARGEGFTTRWYEHPFLTHPLLPRPDDFRYPGLTIALAAAFSAAGTGYSTALHTTSLIFIFFLTALFFILRKRYGPPVALITLAATAWSLLQLYWNAAVYSEGLFGLGICLFAASVRFTDLTRLRSWVIIGLSIAVLYYIRLNGILFLAGLPVYLFIHRADPVKALQRTGTAFGVFLLFSAPWMLRSLILFGNPLHVAGGAGVLRLAADDPRTWSVFEFISHYSPIVFLKALSAGTCNFFTTLHYFEKNLFVLPFAGVLVRLMRTRSAGTPLFAAGSAATLLACCYISYHESWAAVRYASSLLPFLYAAGINEIIYHCRRPTEKRFHLPRITAPLLVALATLSTLYYPHRFFIRHFTGSAPCTAEFAGHVKTLDSLIDTSEYYFADAYGQLAFMSNRKCVGIQAYVDSSCIPLYCSRYHPALIVLNEHEYRNTRIRSIMRAIEMQGFHLREPLQTSNGFYLRIDAPGAYAAPVRQSPDNTKSSTATEPEKP